MVFTTPAISLLFLKKHHLFDKNISKDYKLNLHLYTNSRLYCYAKLS